MGSQASGGKYLTGRSCRDLSKWCVVYSMRTKLGPSRCSGRLQTAWLFYRRYAYAVANDYNFAGHVTLDHHCDSNCNTVSLIAQQHLMESMAVHHCLSQQPNKMMKTKLISFIQMSCHMTSSIFLCIFQVLWLSQVRQCLEEVLDRQPSAIHNVVALRQD